MNIIKRNTNRILLYSLPVIYAWGVFFNHRDPIQMLVDAAVFILWWHIGRLLGFIIVLVIYRKDFR